MKKLKKLDSFISCELDIKQMAGIMGGAGTENWHVLNQATGPYNECSSDERETLFKDNIEICSCIQAIC